jgi:hypothetical protein
MKEDKAMKVATAYAVSRVLWWGQAAAFAVRLDWLGGKFVDGAVAVRDWAGLDWIFNERHRTADW